MNEEDKCIALALQILEKRMHYGEVLGSPDVVKNYLRLKLGTVEHEIFAVIWLTSQNHVIAYEEIFRGTLTQTSVYPRELVKLALKHNAAGAIFCHPHPSGVAEPSHADEHLTRALKQALSLVDVRVLDHMVVTATKVTSMAERGLI